MRTTLTLDDDVAAKLESEAKRSGRSFRDVVNDSIRRGLLDLSRPAPRKKFRIQAREMGRPQPGIDLDDIGALLDLVEGPRRR